MKRLVFAGLGNMGLPMALRLLKAGYDVDGFDVVDAPKDAFVKAGGKWLDGFENINADVVFAMLPGGAEMKRFYVDEQKLFSKLKPNTLIVDCSTADPHDALELYEQAKDQGLRFLSAPVSGGVVGASGGTLTFMVGGDEEDFAAVLPLLELMGKKIFHAGGAGAGQSVKICNNMLLAVQMIGTCEAFALGDALGLDARVLSEIMSASSGSNWTLQVYNPYPGLMDTSPASRDYEGGFSVRLMLKDLSLAMGSMERVEAKMLLGSKAFEIYRKHFDNGFADKDFSHILTSLKR